MNPSSIQGSNTGATGPSAVDRFADPSYRASVREQARKLKEMSTLPQSGEVRAIELPGRIQDMQREWAAASSLGFKVPPEQLTAFEGRLAALNLHDATELGIVGLLAIGLTESMARAMDARLPPDERLRCEWSPPTCPYRIRHDRGHISRVHGPGGTVAIQDSRILQFIRDQPH